MLAPAAAAASPSVDCAPSAAKVLRASALAQLYSQGGVLYGCTAARQTRLGALRGTRPAPGTRIALYALAGHYAGLDTAQMGIDTFDSSVSVYDLRSGRRIATAPGTTPEGRAESFMTVSVIAVNRDGVLAWIGQRSAVGVAQPTYELHLLKAGTNTILATNTVKVANLKLTATTIAWTDATGRRSKRL